MLLKMQILLVFQLIIIIELIHLKKRVNDLKVLITFSFISSTMPISLYKDTNKDRLRGESGQGYFNIWTSKNIFKGATCQDFT